MTPTNEHLVDIDRRLSALVDVLAGELSADERSAIVEFIDVGEYGLALETIVDIFVELERDLPSGALAAITTLSGKMGRESLVSEELRRRAK